MADFVEICKVCARKEIIEAAKRTINSDKVCHSYSDLNFDLPNIASCSLVILPVLFPPGA